jgi:hypothetical protein
MRIVNCLIVARPGICVNDLGNGNSCTVLDFVIERTAGNSNGRAYLFIVRRNSVAYSRERLAEPALDDLDLVEASKAVCQTR